MKIAIDAMGGDHAPGINVEGGLLAAKEWPDTEIVLVGDEAKLAPLLRDKPANVSIRHAADVIEPDDEPVKAVRRKKDASMVVASRMVKENEAQAVISAGNTGALMAAGLLVIGRISGIDRPALAPMIPTKDGKGVLALDLGANLDAAPEHLVQYAVMGSVYRSKMHDIARPRVGLLNVGTEEGKGNDLTKAAFALLQEAPVHFVGNVEARDVLGGTCDVLVCDAFVGNILLKSIEGTAGFIMSELKAVLMRSLPTKLAAAVLKPGLKALAKKMDYTEHGAALLLGIDGLCLKSHGSSNANAIKNAVRQARTAIQNRVVETISAEINTGK